MISLPSGTVTFLFTDIEGSTKLWEQHPDAMKITLAQHDAILRAAVESNDGRIIKTTGDSVQAVFATLLDAVNTTLKAQTQIQAAPGDLQIKVLMGLHTGEAELRDGDYYGQELNSAARIMFVEHGEQFLLSAITAVKLFHTAKNSFF
jgi:class 3 adenylate cyclase